MRKSYTLILNSLIKPLNTFVLLLGFLLSSVITQAQTLEIEAFSNKTDLLTGESLTYTLKYKCAGTTMNCSNVTMTATIPSGILFPAQNIGLTSDIASYTFSADRKTVTFVFNEPLIAGHTGIIELNGTSNFGEPNNTVTTLTADILTGGTSAANATVNTTLHSYNAFCPSIGSGIGLALDNSTLYKINLGYGEGYATGISTAGDVLVVSQLPAGAIIESAVVWTAYPNAVPAPIGTCTIDNGTNTVTCNVPATTLDVSKLNGYTPAPQVHISVRYPTPTFSANQSINNTVTITQTPLDGSPPITITNNSMVAYSAGGTYASVVPKSCTSYLSVDNTLLAPAPKLTIKKTSTIASVKPGENGIYYLDINNTGNITIDNVVIEDILPAEVKIYKINSASFANLSGTENIQYWLKTVSNPTYVPIVFAYSTYDIPVGEQVTAVKVTADFLPSGAANTYGNVTIYYTLDPNATVGGMLKNCITATSSTAGITIDDANACSEIPIKPIDLFSTLKLNKGLSNYPTYGSFYQQPQNIGTIAYSFIDASVLGGGQPLQDPIIMDLLPKGLDYLGDITYNVGTPTADMVEVLPNYNGTGRTLLRLKWTSPWAAGGNFGIKFKSQVNALAVAGNGSSYTSNQIFNQPYLDINGIRNTAFLSGSSPAKCFKQNYYALPLDYAIPDIYDLNGNGIAIPDTICHASDYFGVTSAAQLESIKWVKGQCDANYSRYPDFGNTMAGGIANYRLVVKNNGNVPTKNFEIIDILPWVGDKGVIDPNPRLTDWQPNLVTPFATPPGIIVYYSTEKNPCRTDYVAAGPAGCTAANWSTVLPQDPTTIQSIKLDFGTKVLNPGDQIEITWDMRAPVNAPTNNEIAWNSFAYKAQRADNNDDFLPAEPLKVGIKLKPNQPGNYGNFVWLDTNKDGIQDAAETGIDGVRVELYLDNGDGINNPKTDQLAAFTSTANGGLYLFPAIPVGDYYAVFYLPPGYSNSPANTTADDKDSDGIAATCNGNRVMIVPITTISANETDLTWDQGVFPDKAAVGNYVWFDENQNNIQDESSANGINGVEVCLYTSTGTLVKRDTTSNDVYGRPGYYLFDMLAAGDYYVQFKPTADKTYTPNTGTAGGATSDPTDSDADATGKTATFTLAAGQVDLTWDAGLIIPTGPYKLGNFVWNDVNNDGIANPGEAGINNVTVNLYKDNNNDNKPQASEFVSTTVTLTVGGLDGIYTFDRLPIGNYIVQIPDQNFSTALKDFISSTGNDPAPDPDNNIENDDNGTAVVGCGIISKPITLDANAEPLDAGKTNYSVDFGFYKCAKPNYTASVIQPTCAGGTGSITITGTGGDKVGYTIGALHTGTYSSATLVSSLTGGVVVDNIAGSASDVVYSIRVYNGEEACYKDFTFTISKLVCCTQPTVAAPTGTAGTCNGATPVNDAKVDFTGIVDADKGALWEGATYAGVDYASATATVSLGDISFTGLKHNTQYTFRFWNAGDVCYKDVTFTTPTKTCGVVTSCPPPVGPTPATCSAPTMLATPRYVNGNAVPAGSAAGALSGFSIFDYTNTGETGTVKSVAASQLGATWGVAYKSQNAKLYTSAFLKRHVGYGPSGPGAIYQIDANAATPMASLLVDLVALGVNVGADTRTASAGTVDDANELPTDPTQPSWDVAAFPLIAKRSLGDLDISADGNTLWTINLNEKELIEIDLSTATPTLKSKRVIPNPGCSGNDYVPFGLKVHAGKVWVGTTCTAETSQSTADLKAYITAWTGTTFAPVYDFKLDYKKGFAGGTGGTEGEYWKPWTNTYQSISSSAVFAVYPTPLLSDIEFDTDGSMILGFMDRTGHQNGFINYKPDMASTNLVSAHSGGDILRVCNVGGVFGLEQNGLCPGEAPRANAADGSKNAGSGNLQGPGGGEFYWGEVWTFNPYNPSGGYHQETSFGGLAFKVGSGEIVTTAVDPTNTGISGGIIKMSNTTGRKTDGFKIYDNAVTPTTLGKANGLGDLELFCSAACTPPTTIAYTQTVGTCSSGVALDDAKIDFTGITGADKADKVEGTTYTGGATYATATGTVTTGAVSFTGLKHNTQYTFRIFNGSDACFKDTTFTTPTKTCVTCTPPTTIAYTQTVGTCSSGVALDDAKIDFTGITGADKADKVEGATYTGGATYATATGTVTTGAVTFTGLKHNTAYTFRLFNATNTCFKDTTFTTPTKTCGCVAPVTAGTAANPSPVCNAATGLATITLTNLLTGEDAGGVWTSTGATAGANFDAGAGTLNQNGLAAGTYKFLYTVTGVSPCPNDTEEVTIVINTCAVPCPTKICAPVLVVKH